MNDGCKTKKHLGQHFLIDEKISEQISNAISKSNKINLLEIGPGTGALTKFLLHENIDLISYELDVESITYLKNTFPTLIVYNEDILKTDWTKIFLNETILSLVISPTTYLLKYFSKSMKTER